MKLNTVNLAVLTAVLALAPLTASAVNSTQQPIHTRFAQTQDAISIELSAWSFTELELDEADDFDGWSAAAEVDCPSPSTNTCSSASSCHTIPMTMQRAAKRESPNTVKV
jgi:hypothetical protein